MDKKRVVFLVIVFVIVCATATIIYGETCEDDCTYTDDNLIHKECDGMNGCLFCDTTPEIRENAKNICDLAQPGWIRDYDATQEIECAEVCPTDKREVKATVTCEYDNIIKLIKLIKYKGKLVKLVIVTCG